ncbi:GrpB family protein [Marinomonas sp. 2405UD68-3]|uniref:GrpB family protein n=1 Tax=Marinomonas sp. 2405UD68-3 TaxID=3391835 RepID=UPI0039C9CDF5
MENNEVLIGGIEKVEIKIVQHQVEWKNIFSFHRNAIEEALGEKALLIEHIGSTSVPGLAAKPIIDIVVAVKDAADERDYLGALISAGYQLRVREPDFFQHRMVRTPKRDTHIHIFSEGCGEIEKYLLLRDYLRNKKEARDEYEQVKLAFSKQSWTDMNAYADAKGLVIQKLLHEAANTKAQ